MGDRANVFVKDNFGNDAKGVYLYTHWSGSRLPQTLQKALARKERWDDAAYLARIIFCEMVHNDIDGETGFGISANVGDGDDRILNVDCKKETVSQKSKVWTFQKYVALTDAELKNVWGD